MARYITCDWCAAPIEDEEDYSAEELNRMGLEDEELGRYVLLESRFNREDRHAIRPARSEVAHLHYPHCYEDALRLLRDHHAWAEARDAGRRGAATLRWQEGFVRETPAKGATRKVDLDAVVERESTMRRRAEAGTRLDAAGITPRASNALWRAEVACIEDLAERAEIDIAALEGVGAQTLEKLRGALVDLGLTFKAGVTTPAEFGERLRDLRQLSGITASDLQRALVDAGMGEYGDIGNWQRGAAAPRPDQREWLAERFGVELSELEEAR